MNLVELEAFFPDIEPELPRCPVPVIENRIRDAIIDACERANIWRWSHPEILLIEGERNYDLATPTADTLVHSVLHVLKDGRPLEGCDTVNRHEPYSTPGMGFSIGERGTIQLASVPKTSTPPAPEPIDLSTVDTTLPDVLAVPDDPGPLVAGFPPNLPEKTVPVATLTAVGTNTNSSVLRTTISETVAVGEVVILNLTNFDVTPWVGTGTRGIFIDESYLNVSTANNSNLDTTVDSFILTARDISLAQAAGTPYILAVRVDADVSTVGYRAASDWKAEADDIKVGAPPLSVTEIDFAPSLIAHSNVNGVTLTLDTDFANFLDGLNVYDYFKARTDVTVSVQDVRNATFDLPNGQSYDIDYRYAPYAPNLDDSNLNGSPYVYNRNMVFWIVRKPTATENGLLAWRGWFNDYLGSPLGGAGDLSGGWVSTYELFPDGIVEGEAVTQEDIDAYQAELALYNASVVARQTRIDELAAINQFIANYPTLLENRVKGLELLLSIKPSRTTLYVDEVLRRDYHDLIVLGSLARALAMRGRPWSDPNLAKDYKNQYEFALAKARQGIDRGFKTGSQRFKPRKFT